MTKDHSHREDHEIEQGAPAEIGRQEPSESPPPEAASNAAGSAVSAEEFAKLKAEKEELTNTLVRRQADFENYRKRIERERKEEARRGAGRLMHELLPVLDGLERALRAHSNPEDEYRKGVELIYRHLWEILSKNGLQRIEVQNQRFDPHFHEAIERVETNEHPEGTVIQVLQEGYLFDGRVLRPSLVRVAVVPEEAGGDKSAEHSRVQ